MYPYKDKHSSGSVVRLQCRRCIVVPSSVTNFFYPFQNVNPFVFFFLQIRVVENDK